MKKSMKMVFVGGLLFVFPLFCELSMTHAGDKICADHGGVDTCDKSTGYYRCEDGSLSPVFICGVKEVEVDGKVALYRGSYRISRWFEDISDKEYCDNHRSIAYVGRQKGREAVYIDQKKMSSWFDSVSIKKVEGKEVQYVAKKDDKKARFINRRQVSEWE